MPFYGSIVVIKRSGEDGNVFPLMAPKCVFGRALECDIRIYIPTVSLKHCYLEVGYDGQVYVISFEKANPTALNNHNIAGRTPIQHGDVITICERSFRFEYPPDSSLCNIGKQPQAKPSTPASRQDLRQDANMSSSKLPKSPVSMSKPQSKSGKKVKASPSEIKASARKNVSFGPYLSPEQYNKALPPSTPVYKGGLPKRRASVPDYFGSPIVTPLRSVKSKCLLTPTVKTIREESPRVLAPKSPQNGTPQKSPEKKQKATPSPSGDNAKTTPRQQKSAQSTAQSPLAEKKIQDRSPVKTPDSKASVQSSKLSSATKKQSPKPAGALEKSPKKSPIKETKPKSPNKKVSPIKKAGRLSLSLKKDVISPSKAPGRKSLPSVVKSKRGTPKTPGSVKKRLSLKLAVKPSPKRMVKKSLGSSTPSKVAEQASPSDRSHVLVSATKSPPTSQTVGSQAGKSMLGSPGFSHSKQIAIVQPLMGSDSPSKFSSHSSDSFKLNLSSSSASPDVTEAKDSARKSSAKVRKSVPKIQSPSSPDVKKSKALRNIHGSQLRTQSMKKTLSKKKPGSLLKKSATKPTLAVQSRARKPLFSEVLKFHPKSKTPAHKRSAILSVKTGKPSLKAKIKPLPASLRKTKMEVATTGHANSPETIVIKKTKKMPSVTKTRKGRKTPHKTEVAKLKSVKTRKSTGADLNLTGIADMMSSPRNSSLTDSQARIALTDNTFDITAINASNISTSVFVSPLMSPASTRKARSTGGKVAKATPTSSRKGAQNADPKLTGIKKLLKSPRKSIPANYTNVGGVKKLFASPKATPKADYLNVSGIKKLVRSPRKSVPANYANVSGIERLFRSPDLTPGSAKKSPVSDYRARGTPRANFSLTDAEIGRLFSTPPELADILDGGKTTTPRKSAAKKLSLTNSAGPSTMSSTPVKKGSATKRQSISKSQETPRSKLKRSISPSVAQTLGDVLNQLKSPVLSKAKRASTGKSPIMKKKGRTSITPIKLKIQSPRTSKPKGRVSGTPVKLDAKTNNRSSLEAVSKTPLPSVEKLPTGTTPSSATRGKRGAPAGSTAKSPSPRLVVGKSPKTASPKAKTAGAILKSPKKQPTPKRLSSGKSATSTDSLSAVTTPISTTRGKRGAPAASPAKSPSPKFVVSKSPKVASPKTKTTGIIQKSPKKQSTPKRLSTGRSATKNDSGLKTSTDILATVTTPTSATRGKRGAPAASPAKSPSPKLVVSKSPKAKTAGAIQKSPQKQPTPKRLSSGKSSTGTNSLTTVTTPVPATRTRRGAPAGSPAKLPSPKLVVSKSPKPASPKAKSASVIQESPKKQPTPKRPSTGKSSTDTESLATVATPISATRGKRGAPAASPAKSPSPKLVVGKRLKTASPKAKIAGAILKSPKKEATPKRLSSGKSATSTDSLATVTTPVSATRGKRGAPAASPAKSPSPKLVIGKSPKFGSPKAKTASAIQKSPKKQPTPKRLSSGRSATDTDSLTTVTAPISATRGKRGAPAASPAKSPSPKLVISKSPKTASPKAKTASAIQKSPKKEPTISATRGKRGAPAASPAKSPSKLVVGKSPKTTGSNKKSPKKQPTPKRLSTGKKASETDPTLKSTSDSLGETSEASSIGTPQLSVKSRGRKGTKDTKSPTQSKGTGTPKMRRGRQPKLALDDSEKVSNDVATPGSASKKRGQKRRGVKSPSSTGTSPQKSKLVENTSEQTSEALPGTPVSSGKKKGRNLKDQKSPQSVKSATKSPEKVPSTRKGRRQNALGSPVALPQETADKSDESNEVSSPSGSGRKAVKATRSRRGQAKVTPVKIAKRGKAVEVGEASPKPEAVATKRTTSRSKKQVGKSPQLKSVSSHETDTSDSKETSSPVVSKVAGKPKGKGKAAAAKTAKGKASPASKRKAGTRGKGNEIIAENVEEPSLSEVPNKRTRGNANPEAPSTPAAKTPSPARKRKGTHAAESPSKMARKEVEEVSNKVSPPKARGRRGARPQEKQSPKLSASPRREAETSKATTPSPAPKGKAPKKSGKRGAEKIATVASPIKESPPKKTTRRGAVKKSVEKENEKVESSPVKPEATRARRVGKAKSSPSKSSPQPAKASPPKKASPTKQDASPKRGNKKQGSKAAKVDKSRKVNFLSPVAKVLDTSISSTKVESPRGTRGTKATKSNSPVKTTRTTRRKGPVKK